MVGVLVHPWSLLLMPVVLRFQLSVCNCIGLHQFQVGRALLLLHCEQDLPWEPTSPASSGGGEGAGAGVLGASRLSLTQAVLALANPFFEL